jgi:Uncharacterized conserved protein, contains S4-like domain
MEINNFFLLNMAERVENEGSTLFLNYSELSNVSGILNKRKIKFFVYYPYKNSEKAIIYKGKEPSIKLLKIITKETLKHSDILGSLFANQISPNQYGDIIIDKGNYYVMILESMFPYFQTQFSKIGKWYVEFEIVSIDKIKDFEYEFEILNYFVTSLRIDNVVSSITSLSRSSVDDMFVKKDVLLWYESVKKVKNLKEKDIISIRRFGKYKINEILDKNKKGKIKIELYKYK